jgi:anti-sigma factor RsiW
MSCRQTQELLDAYIDKELDVVNTLEFERHLSECGGCRAMYDQYQQAHDSVKSRLPYFEAPAHLENKIHAQLRSAARDRNAVLRKEWFPHWRSWAIAAAVVVLFALGTVFLKTSGRFSGNQLLADEIVSSHIRSLMANHLVDVPSSDQHTVKPWFNGKLDFAPVVKDLSELGYPLTGGRLDYIDNRTVAALVYKHRQHTINLFLWPSSGADSGPHNLTIKGYHVVCGTRSHMIYWAVSDLNAAELGEFVREVEK